MSRFSIQKEKEKQNEKPKTPRAEKGVHEKGKVPYGCTPFTELTPEQQHDFHVKGGKASQLVRKRKRSLAELAAVIGDSDIKSAETKKTLSNLGIDVDEMTNNAAVVASIYRSAIRGNMSAVDKWEQLTERVKSDKSHYELPASQLGKAFVDINRQIEPNKEYVFKGGRGSLKSSYVGFKVIELIKNNPLMNACVVRKVSNTLKDSVYAQIRWCIIQLGLEEQFKFTTSPMEIKYIKTGQVIYFRGADDPAKLKSIKPSMGYIGILWFEEVDQFNGDEELRNIQQSVLRGGDKSYLFKSYNPPKSRSNFMNKYVLEPKSNLVVHSSNYKDSPIEWLGEFFINEAEHLKETRPDAYENEYMGVANGSGGLVFDNVEARTITDDEIKKFDRIFQGVDWGWYPDQYAFLRTYYDSARETIYIFDENYVNKQSNAETGKWILDHGYNDYPVICDSAEPKSVNDYIDLSIPARGAIKGAGSVDYGFKWLQRRKIVVDSVRCPNAYRELMDYEYEKDKEGNDISGYPDGNDHAISALRYAYEPLFNRRGASA